MTQRDDAAILDLLKAANLVQEFIGSMKKEASLQDTKTQSAVLHQLLLFGETVKRLSEDCDTNIRRFLGKKSPECVTS